MTGKTAFEFDAAVLGYFRAFTEPLTFQIPEGKITAIIGRNGSGKTTLVRALLGESVLLSGRVRFKDNPKNLKQHSASEIARILAFVPQETHFPGDLRVRNYLQLAFLPQAGFWGKLPDAHCTEINEMLRRFGLEELSERVLSQLSTGERQKVYLCRALLQKTEALVLDEPTNHLDPAGVNDFWQGLAKGMQGRTVVVSTHDLNFVSTRADYVIGLEKGRIAFCGTRERFLEESIATMLFGQISLKPENP